MSSFGVKELTQLGAYGCTVGGKGTLQNAIVIGSQKFNSSPRMCSEISSVGDFESVDYLCLVTLQKDFLGLLDNDQVTSVGGQILPPTFHFIYLFTTKSIHQASEFLPASARQKPVRERQAHFCLRGHVWSPLSLLCCAMLCYAL